MAPQTTQLPITSWYTGSQVAELFAVHAATVVRWADAGKIPSFRTPGGHRRYPRTAIDALLRGAA